MNVAARRNLLLLLCSAALFSGCGILGNETHDGRRVKRWSKEWYEMESQAPVGARQKEHAGQLWPPFARPTGEGMQFSHKYHHAHYWPYPYNCEDRDFVRSLSAQQVANGWVSHTTLYDYHFDAETHKLNNSGNLKLKWILEHAPEAFGDLIIRDGLLDELGPAICSGKSIFIYGPPGNGKTMIAKGLGNFLNIYGGDVYVPYAIAAEGAVITVYDPTVHQTTDSDDLIIDAEGFPVPGLNRRAGDHPLPDSRWRRIRRPVVMTGGELTLEMLDLRYNSTSNFYTAPLHIKANGGVFLIDDFGRQIVSPRDLLNRWILPLEEHVDFLSLATGKKFTVPFEQLIIFSTNLDPRELVDEAFLRRIRHKIEVGSPNRELYTEIFQLCCRQRQVPFSPEVVDYLYSTYYDRGKPPRSSDPRDLLEITKSICRFKKQRVVLTPELISEAAKRFFCQI
jgi:hypothetical protein